MAKRRNQMRFTCHCGWSKLAEPYEISIHMRDCRVPRPTTKFKGTVQRNLRRRQKWD
jgi:hypothetical protein